MKWNVDENDPELRGSGAKVLCDGEVVSAVYEIDTDEGRVGVVCTGQKPGHATEPHPDPRDPGEVCRVTLRGSVEVHMPDGRVLT